MADYSQYEQTYTSFTGADMVATIAGVNIGTLLSVSFSIQREKAGIYTCGSPDYRSVSRGKRGIAGTLIFQVFNRDALYQIVADESLGFQFWQRNSNVSMPERKLNMPLINNDLVDWRQQSHAWGTYVPFYADQIPPFDITMSFLNEIGNMAVMDIRGVEILNEGMGVSVEDMAIEQAMTFIARSVGKITPIDKQSQVGSEIEGLLFSDIKEYNG
jgi:hypothetical protein